jgi:hypothetical protein
MSTFEELRQRANNKGYDIMTGVHYGVPYGGYRLIFPDHGTHTLYSLKELESEIARLPKTSGQTIYEQEKKAKSDPAKAEAKRMLKHKYRVSYGQSVYYKNQDEATKHRTFNTKKEAYDFLARVNKRKDVDFSDVKEL